jgi:hypothetical protein
MDYEYEHEYISFKLQVLDKERATIIRRGTLSDEQDMRLNEIDAEISLYMRFLNDLA